MVKWLTWLWWTTFYLFRRPKNLNAFIVRFGRIRSPRWKFRPCVYHNDDGKQWEINLTNESSYARPGTLAVTLLLSQGTGQVTGLVIFDETLAAEAEERIMPDATQQQMVVRLATKFMGWERVPDSADGTIAHWTKRGDSTVICGCEFFNPFERHDDAHLLLEEIERREENEEPGIVGRYLKIRAELIEKHRTIRSWRHKAWCLETSTATEITEAVKVVVFPEEK